MKRRSFIFLGAAAAALPASRVPAATEKLNMGIIGCGGRGRSNMGGVASSEHIYAVCDVNQAAIDAAKMKYPDAKVYHDWRELLQDPKIDAVTVSTSDHTHAAASIAAMKAGKHVYCEKPLAHNVHEARWMRETFAKTKVATQMGTQIHAGANYRRVVELVQGGAIGKVREAHVWCSRSINPVGQAVLPEEPIPETFHWDLWLGPAADRAYNTGYWKGGNLNWNRRWDFGNGVLGDMGSHLIDLPWWALKLKTPTSVSAQGPAPDPVAAPPWQEITWEHPARKDPFLDVPVKVTWYHGGKQPKHRPKIDVGMDLGPWFNGILFVGDDGMLLADYGKRFLLPKEKFSTYQAPKQSIPNSKGHYNEWLHAIRSGEPTTCNFEYSGSLIEHNLLGNVAYRSGKKLKWNAAAMKTGDAGADALLGGSYRSGWEIG